MRKIDVSSRIFPQTYWSRLQTRAGRNIDIGQHVRSHPVLTDLDERFRIMDRFGDYEQILSLASPPLEAIYSADTAPEMARIANDGLAELVSAHPDRFPGFIAALPMARPDAAIAETFRAVKELGALGVQIFTDVGGRPLDHEDYVPIFRAAYQLDIAMILQPASEAKHELSAAQGRLVFSGLMDMLPGIKIVTHHMGGMVPIARSIVGPSALKRLKKPHAEYFKDFYADTAACLSSEAVRDGMAYHPRDRVLFASDAPFDPDRSVRRIGEVIHLVEDSDIDADWKQDIFWRNAAKIMAFDRREDETILRRYA